MSELHACTIFILMFWLVVNILKTIPQAQAAYIGFPNGDLVSIENYGSDFWVRQAASSYGNNLVRFEPVADASNTSLIRSNVAIDAGAAYDSTIRFDRCTCLLTQLIRWCVTGLGIKQGSVVAERMVLAQEIHA